MRGWAAEANLPVFPWDQLAPFGDTARQHPDGIVDLSIGTPVDPTPAVVQAALRAASDAPGYPLTIGTPALRAALVAWSVGRLGADVTAANVCPSIGSKELVSLLPMLLGITGKQVLIPALAYPTYDVGARLAGCEPVATDDPTQHDPSKVGLVWVNSPSNPTGAVYPVAALEALAKVAVKHQIPVLSDEIYEKLIYDGAVFRSFASFGEEVRQLTIIVSGVSKAYAMTGWRIGWSIAPAALTTVIDNLQSQQTSNPCSISQHAAIAGLTGPQDSVIAMHAEFVKRRAYVLDRFRQIPHVKFVEPGGAFYIFFDVSHYFGKTLQGGKVVQNATEFCTALLETAHVALVTGDAFGAKGYVRLSFATNIETLGAGIDRLAGFLNPV